MEGLRDCDSVQYNEHYDKFEEPCKFITSDFDFVNLEHIKNRLMQNTGFIVVGVIGKQSVGKSFVLNMLANNFTDHNMNNKSFETATINDLLNFSQKTSGIDIHVTSDRVILLDTQAILNANHLGKSMEKEKKIKVYSNDENNEGESKIKMSYSPDILSVQIISFLLSVCHVLLVVDDHVVNYRLLRLIDLAHRLKPWISYNASYLPLDEPKSSTSGFYSDSYDEFHDYTAQMVFVENMSQKRRDTSDEHVKELVDGINRLLIGYRSRIEEQNALMYWLKENRDRQLVKQQTSKKRRKKIVMLEEHRELDNKQHIKSNVDVAHPLDDATKSENASQEDDEEEEDEETSLVDKYTEVSSTIQSEIVSDNEDEQASEKSLNRSIYRPVKVFLMPFFDNDPDDEEDSEFEDAVYSFQKTVFGLPRKHFCVTQSEQFTELCWIEYAVHMWHNIRNSQVFTDYFYSFSNVLINDL